MREIKEKIKNFEGSEEFKKMGNVKCPFCGKIMMFSIGGVVDNCYRQAIICHFCDIYVTLFGECYNKKQDKNEIRVWHKYSAENFISKERYQFLRKVFCVQFTNGLVFSYIAKDLDNIPTYVQEGLCARDWR